MAYADKRVSETPVDPIVVNEFGQSALQKQSTRILSLRSGTAQLKKPFSLQEARESSASVISANTDLEAESF